MNSHLPAVLTDKRLSPESRIVLAVMLLRELSQSSVTELRNQCGLEPSEVDAGCFALKAKRLGSYSHGIFTLKTELFPEPTPEPVKQKKRTKSK